VAVQSALKIKRLTISTQEKGSKEEVFVRVQTPKKNATPSGPYSWSSLRDIRR